METRDKLFTEEQYIKQLAKYTTRIEKLNSMIEQSEKDGDEISPDLYGRLFDCRVYTIVTMYSMGENLESIKSNYYFNNQCFRKMLDSVWLLCSDVMVAFNRNHVGV